MKDDADISRVLGEPETDAAGWISLQERWPGFGGINKHPYKQLLHELPTRLAVEAALKAGEEPQDDGRLGEKRFRLVVMNERRYLKGEIAAFSCACEASLVQSLAEDADEDGAA